MRRHFLPLAFCKQPAVSCSPLTFSAPGPALLGLPLPHSSAPEGRRQDMWSGHSTTMAKRWFALCPFSTSSRSSVWFLTASSTVYTFLEIHIQAAKCLSLLGTAMKKPVLHVQLGTSPPHTILWLTQFALLLDRSVTHSCEISLHL